MFASTLLLAALLTPSGAPGPAPVFYPDDPLRVDQDRLDTPAQPAPVELSDLYDRFSHIVHDFGGDAGEAGNVNTLDEVPDSSWFTNRHGVRRMTLEELIRGPNQGPGPAVPWTVFKTKIQGLTPGFHVEDATGRRFVIKLDSPAAPELNSSSELIATKIFHAIGYNVPENHLAFIHPEDLRIQPGTEMVDRFGDRMPLTRKRLERILRQAARLEDGRLRVVASQYVDGEPLGPFRYFGTRSDDPNDVIAHEDRRELRGLRVFAAWLNHDDSRAQNTLDAWVEEDGRHFVRHYLIDFGSTLGSGTVDLQLPNLGFHYWLDAALIKLSASSFGFHTPKYRKVDWPEQTRLPGVGRFESDAYDPAEWKNDYPNPAFVRMTSRDAFWAAKIVMAFTEDELRAIVGTGRFSNREAEEYVFETLVHRQRKTAGDFLNRLNPLAGFRVEGGMLRFVNLAERHRLGPAGSRYRHRWFTFDNATGQSRAMGPEVVGKRSSVEVPEAPMSGLADPMLMLEIFTEHEDRPLWNQGIQVYLRPYGSGYEVVGIRRGPAFQAGMTGEMPVQKGD